MPYQSTSDLPESVRGHLPRHAQEIHQAAYNSARDEFGKNEERAHCVAWGAVKRDYEKDDDSGEWHRRKD